MKQTSLRSIAATAVVVAGSCAFAQTGNMAVNNDGRKPHVSAILDVSSNYLPLATAEQKGMLIPRMTTAQRNAIAPTVAQQGIMVYQTDGVPGFYYFEYGQWVRLDAGADSWDVIGNNPTIVANEFLGTRDNVDFVFRTNNVEAMRVKGTNGARYVGIGTTTPAEAVDVNGAIRIFNPSPGSWAGTNPNTRFAATNNQGTILFRPPGTGSPGDTLFSTFVPGAPQNRDAIMWAGHWGNIDGTPPFLPAADANSGGWRKLENDYSERAQKAYQQQGTPVCGAGFSEIPQGSNTYSNGLGLAGLLITPFKYDVPLRRYRNQYMFLASELNVEQNQLNGNTTATMGLCPGQPVNSIGFWINQAIAAGAPPNPSRTLNISVTVKHVPLGVNDLNGGFDNSVDPAQGCLNNGALPWPLAAGAAAWHTFNLTTPFVWDGVRNIIVEVAVGTAAGGTGNVANGLPVRYTTTATNLTYGAYSAPVFSAPCSPATGLAGSCGPLNIGTAIASNCGTFGASIYRPVIRFGGTVTTAPALTSSISSYLYYQGGFVSEATTTGSPYGRQITPYYAFRGPGTITAENGVYDNGVLLNDHVFDRAFDGQVAPKDAPKFGTLRNHSIEEMAEFTRMNRHLPTVKGRDAWRIEGGFSFGDLTNQLWTTTETQALYVTELNDKLNVLELLSTDRTITSDEFDLARQQLAGVKTYTDGEKGLLLEGLRNRVVTTQQH